MEEQKSKRLEECMKQIEELNRLCDPDILQTVTLSELYETVYESKPPVIEDILFPGLCIVAGDSKIGKSFLVSQFAYHVAAGTDVWDKKVAQGTVLYLALEDKYPRLQKRMYKMFSGESTENLHFSVISGTIDDNLEKQLTNFITAHKNTNLIIIDTLQRVRGKTTESYSYANDYEVVSKFKAIADNYGICLLMVHHTRKDKKNDPFENINGTTAIMGAADETIIISKENRTSNNAVLNITGRDQPETKIEIVKNRETLLWELVRFDDELYREEADPLIALLAEKVHSNGGQWNGSASALADFLGTDLPPNKLTYKLNINASNLLTNYSIEYKSRRDRNGRQINLKQIEPEAVTIDDDSADKTQGGILSA